MKKVMSVCGYVISALLFLSYVIILGSSAYPKVCIEYELYYIERELQDWPGYGGLQYQLGTPVTFCSSDENRTERRGNSWNCFEEDGCWTYGSHSSLYFSGISGTPETEAKDLFLTITVQDVREGAESEVCINGEKIGIIDSSGFFCFDIPGDLLEGEVMLLEFLTDGFGAVGEDSRNQGIKVREIVIDDAVE